MVFHLLFFAGAWLLGRKSKKTRYIEQPVYRPPPPPPPQIQWQPQPQQQPPPQYQPLPLDTRVDDRLKEIEKLLKDIQGSHAGNASKSPSDNGDNYTQLRQNIAAAKNSVETAKEKTDGIAKQIDTLKKLLSAMKREKPSLNEPQPETFDGSTHSSAHIPVNPRPGSENERGDTDGVGKVHSLFGQLRDRMAKMKDSRRQFHENIGANLQPERAVG